MKRRIPVAISLVLLLLAATIGAIAVSSLAVPDVADGQVVQITYEGFVPRAITVPVGSTITWVNDRAEPVSIHSGFAYVQILLPILRDARMPWDGPRHEGAPTLLNWGATIEPGESWSRVFTTADVGTNPYRFGTLCTGTEPEHPGHIFVVEGPSSTPTPTPTPTGTPTATPTPTPTSTPTATPTPTPTLIPVYTYEVINEYPHDSNAFTQGLVFETGVLFEGTGLHGRSSLRRVELETGAVVQILDLPSEYFGEGITVYRDEIVQLTWQSHVGFVYDKETFEQLSEFHYPSEGWGITYDGEYLIMSDGTATLHFLDPQTFEEISTIQVYDDAGLVTRLNELEYIQGKVYANVWCTDCVAMISPQTGQVVGWIDLAGLLSPEEAAGADVLNGIAYDAENDRLFVTGKLWPKLFEIELNPGP